MRRVGNRRGGRGGTARRPHARDLEDLLEQVALFWLAVAGWLGWPLADVPGSLAAPALTATATLLPGTGAIAGWAWDDVNGNGQREGAEPPLPGLNVTLANAAGQTIATALSGADGSYRLGNLVPGLYRLTGAPPLGYHLTTQAEFNAISFLLNFGKDYLLGVDGSIRGFNIGINSGAVAGQTVPHCHTHLIPRRDHDVDDPRGGVRHIIPDKGFY